MNTGYRCGYDDPIGNLLIFIASDRQSDAARKMMRGREGWWARHHSTASRKLLKPHAQYGVAMAERNLAA
ncbi:hypothetical protein [Dyella sp.]|uniref:hypothetical protein n=1 Tax=Dyella sp. TaxID=1869338 RepID=UPI002ED05B9D